jgi:hypothetical protein
MLDGLVLEGGGTKFITYIRGVTLQTLRESVI